MLNMTSICFLLVSTTHSYNFLDSIIIYSGHIIRTGLINPSCVALIGNGVVVHVPSFFAELEKIESKGECVLLIGRLRLPPCLDRCDSNITYLFTGLNADDRLFVSDRAHLVFDFHQRIDGLKEVELGRGSIGTTGKGIGPTYSSKASRSGLRVHHLYNFEEFSEKFRTMVANKKKRYGHFDYDVEAEIERYKVCNEII
jgi:adenylosuccinate synthase